MGLSFCFAENSQNLSFQSQENKATELAGEFYGVPVPIGNYYFAKRVVMSFGASWRGTPKDEKELEDLVWQELLFSYEAFRRGVKASEDEVDEEIEKMLKANKVNFKWRIDKEEFQKWTQETLGVSIDIFRNQVEHLVTIEKMRKEIINSIEPEVTEDEAYQKFLDEYNTLLVELVQFDDKDEARQFYEQSIQPVTEKDLEELVWNDLLLSYEAFKRGIKAEDEQVDEAITKLLRGYDARFNWKNDNQAFGEWSMEKISVPVAELKNTIRRFMVIDILRRKIANNEEKAVDPDSKYTNFLQTNRTIAIAYKQFFEVYASPRDDLVRFENLNKAKEFYKKIKRQAGFWEDEKRQTPDKFKQPGFVALDFLLHMWKFKREDAYKMLDEEIGAFYPPAPIYKGYGVFKILKVRKAEQSKYEERKDYYRDKIKRIKQYEGFREWAKELKEKANIRVFISSPGKKSSDSDSQADEGLI